MTNEINTVAGNAAKVFEARMYGIGHSVHATEAAARRALSKFRKAYREMHASMPYPTQQITKAGKAIYTA